MSFKREFERKNINIPLELLKRINEYSNITGLNFTASVITLLNKSLNIDILD